MWQQLGSLDAAWAFLRGDDIAIFPATIELGECPTGNVKETQLRVVNLSSSPVSLTGIYTSCSCVLVSALPTTIDPHATYSLHLTIHSPEQPGDFQRNAVIYTSSQTSPQFSIAISGRTRNDASRQNASHTAEEPNSDNERRTQADHGGWAPTPAREPDLASLPNAAGGQATP
jgi:hypothetical protein